MYYRYKFLPRQAGWCVQVSSWGLIWKAVVRVTSGESSEPTRATSTVFDTIEDAHKFVSEKGIDRMYRLSGDGASPALDRVRQQEELRVLLRACLKGMGGV